MTVVRCERLHDHGVAAAAEQLKQLQYDVVFSQRLLARVLAHTLRRLRD